MGRKYNLVSLFCITASAVTLYDCPSFYAPYLIAAGFALYCLWKVPYDRVDRETARYRIVVAISAVAAVFVLLANYSLWLHPLLPDIRSPLFVRVYKLLLILIILSGAFLSVLSILTYIVYDPDSFKLSGRKPSPKHRLLYFFIPFCIITAVYVTVYCSCYYPGLLSVDSIDQVTQVFTGEYSNHQPFFHTMAVGAFIRAGLALFSDINGAVALYSVTQIVFVAAVFAFSVYTMARLDIPVWCEACATAMYALMPYHIMYSFTMWKDIYFGAFTTLFILFFVRYRKGIGKTGVNLTGFAVSGLVICLIRSNGLFAYVIVLIAMILLLRKERKLMIIMTVTVVSSFALKHGLLLAIGVTAPDTVESLSIPLQQISRVIADDGHIEDRDMAFLEQIIDVSSVKDIYDPDISDPIKNAIRDFGNQEYLSANMGGFAGLYLRTFLHNPTEYVIAWVDSTCGYWNAGYSYWIWYWDVEQNDYGISRTVRSEGMLHFMDEYLWLFYNNRILQVFTSIGLFVWICLAVLAKGTAVGDRTVIIATVPVFAILLSLVISSPVFSEFRYMYALFCAAPFIFTLPGASSGTDDGAKALQSVTGKESV